MNMNVKTLTTIGASVAVVGVLAISYISAFNAGNKAEQGIKAAYTDNTNVLSQYTLKISEAAQIPAMQRDDLTKVVQASLSARYGENGSQAAMQWLKEQNPQIDSTVYTKLQQMIEAGRNDFTVAQTKLIDRKRGYETQLGSFWRGTWLSAAGYPKVNLADYKIVVSSQAKKTFETGVDEGIKLR